jgi:hypothetical protein
MSLRRVSPVPDASANRRHRRVPTRLLAAGSAALTALAVVAVAVAGQAVRSDAAARTAGTVESAVAPAAPRIDTFNGSVTNGASQNELYLFLAAHAGQLVRVSVQVSAPVHARLTGNPRSLTLSSGCGGAAAPANCARAAGLADTTYAIYAGHGGGTAVTSANGRYTVSGHFAVGQPVHDATGRSSLPLRAVELGGPGISEEDDE